MARFTAFMALVGGLVFVGAEPAAAATVVGGTQPLIVTGGHGVVNSISVTESGNELLVSDAGDVITPGDGCAAISAHSVRCPADVKEVQVNAGDRRDVVTINVTSVSTTVDAGTGAGSTVRT